MLGPIGSIWGLIGSVFCRLASSGGCREALKGHPRFGMVGECPAFAFFSCKAHVRHMFGGRFWYLDLQPGPDGVDSFDSRRVSGLSLDRFERLDRFKRAGELIFEFGKPAFGETL